MKNIISYTLFLVFASLPLKSYGQSLLNISKNDFVIGEENAPITIIEYASLSCGHCADFHTNTLNDIKEEYMDKGLVKFVFRDFPFN